MSLVTFLADSIHREVPTDLKVRKSRGEVEEFCWWSDWATVAVILFQARGVMSYFRSFGLDF